MNLNKWEKLRIYVKEELDKPINNDDIPRFILEDILDKMDVLDAEEKYKH